MSVPLFGRNFGRSTETKILILCDKYKYTHTCTNTNHYEMFENRWSVAGLSPQWQADTHNICNQHSSRQIKICKQNKMPMHRAYELP